MGAQAVMLGFAEVDGDLSDGGVKFREVLSSLEFTQPTGGTMRLDENRNGIVDNFVIEVVELDDGSLGTRAIQVVRDLNQTLGQDLETFLAAGPVGRDNPSCP